jgi:hypothetical protein
MYINLYKNLHFIHFFPCRTLLFVENHTFYIPILTSSEHLVLTYPVQYLTTEIITINFIHFMWKRISLKYVHREHTRGVQNVHCQYT